VKTRRASFTYIYKYLVGFILFSRGERSVNNREKEEEKRGGSERARQRENRKHWKI
jgi:hypothetical protein